MTMTEYIKKMRGKCAFCKNEKVCKNRQGSHWYCWQPAVDVVEVVRCKDCKRFDPLYGEVGICNLHTAQAHGNVTMQPDDFCSYGERKDNER